MHRLLLEAACPREARDSKGLHDADTLAGLPNRWEEVAGPTGWKGDDLVRDGRSEIDLSNKGQGMACVSMNDLAGLHAHTIALVPKT